MKTKLSGIIVVIAFFIHTCYALTAQTIPYLDDSQGILEATQGDTLIGVQDNIHGAYNRMYQKSSGSLSDISPEVRIIVELKGEPLAKVLQKELPPDARKFVISARLAEYETQFERLETDLKQIYRTQKRSGSPAKLEFGKKYTKLFFGQSLVVDHNIVNSIRSLPYVIDVHVDRQFKINLDESVPQINADSVWQEFGNQGDSVKVGIMDTGIDYMHPDLGGGFGAGYKVAGGYDFVNGDNDPMDDHYHGTHVAGIVAADGELKGVAPKALLYALKVLDAMGSGYESDIIEALEWAVDPNDDLDFSDRLDVLNMSFGGPPREEDPLVEAIEEASIIGVVSCIAAGNSGSSPYNIGSPGVSPSAVTVGAVDKDDNLVNFSSGGPTLYTRLLKPDIVAPGVYINSTYRGGGYEKLSGTSMANPHVAGVCALLKRQHPAWGPEEMKSAIMLSAKDLGVEKNLQGAGRVDAFNAIIVNTRVDKPSLSLGQDTLSYDAVWTSSDSVRIKNISDVPQSYSLGVSGEKPGITLTLSNSIFTLDPDEDTLIRINISVDNSLSYQPNSQSSYIFTGSLDLFTPDQTLTIPWMFLRGLKLELSDTTNLGLITFISNSIQFFSRTWNMDKMYQTLFAPGEYYIIAEFEEGIEYHPYFMRTSVIRHLELTSSQTINIDKDSAINKIIFNTQDEQGRSYTDLLMKDRCVAIELNDTLLYTIERATIKIPPSGGYTTGAVASWSSWPFKYLSTGCKLQFEEDEYCKQMDTLFINNLPGNARIVMAEVRKQGDNHVDVCFNSSELYSDLSGETVLNSNPADYRSLIVKEIDSTENQKWYPKFYYKSGRFNDWTFDISSIDDKNVSQYTVHMPPQVDMDENFNFYFSAQRGLDFYTSPLRLINDTFYYGEGNIPGALPIQAGDTITQGQGAWMSGVRYWYDPYWPLEALLPFSKGSLNEEGIGINARCNLYNEEGEVIDSAWDVINLDHDPGRYHATVWKDTKIIMFNIPVIDSLDIWLNIGSDDQLPPTLTSFYIKDFSDRTIVDITKNDSAVIVFAVADEDYAYPQETFYGPVLADSTTVYARDHYGNDWLPVEIDTLTYHPKTGMVYSGILKETNYDTAYIDIKIRAVDDGGNSTETILSPALFVKNYQPPTAVDDVYEVTQGTRYNSNVPITYNDINPFGRTEDLRIEILSEVSNGVLTVLNTWGDFRYRPDDDFLGNDSYTYRVYNEKYSSNTATVTLNVVPDALPAFPDILKPGIIIYPNPASDNLTIQLFMDRPENLQVNLYELTGRKVTTVFSGELATGEHKIVWEIKNNERLLQPGIYIIRIEGDTIHEQYKVIID